MGLMAEPALLVELLAEPVLEHPGLVVAWQLGCPSPMAQLLDCWSCWQALVQRAGELDLLSREHLQRTSTVSIQLAVEGQSWWMKVQEW